MVKIAVGVNNRLGKIKPMHAVNNGPYHKEGNQNNSNLQFSSFELQINNNEVVFVKGKE